MKRPLLPILSVLAFFTGCLKEGTTPLVPQGPLGPSAAAPVQRHTALTNPSTNVELAARVDRVGRQILDANPTIGIQPLFRTVGAPHVEIFHRGTADIYITEGLASRCPTDGQLAAVLCTELGKMVAEREAIARPEARNAWQEPPMDVRVGPDHFGGIGSPDLTRQAELGRFERDRRQAKPAACPPRLPDPAELARGYLSRAGFAPAELDSVAPLLKAAALHGTIEQQMKQPPPGPTWHR